MRTRSHRSIATERSGDILFLALVVVSYVIAFAVPLATATPLRIVALFATGALYTVNGIYGSKHAERAANPRVLALYFAIQLALGSIIVYLSEVRGMLIMLPLIGQSIEWLAGRWRVISCAVVSLVTLAAGALIISSEAAAQGARLAFLTSGEFRSIFMPVILQYGLATAFVVIWTQFAVRERETRAQVERLADELEQANAKLRAYAAEAEELATLRERNRLAREIHDGLGHHLTAINMQLEAGRAVLAHDQALALDALDKAQGLAQDGLAEVRRSVVALRASPLDTRTLVDAVGELVDELRAVGVATGYAVEGSERTLDPQVGLALYRAAQEATTNIRKHAQASSAQLTLDYGRPDAVCLAVWDNGVGSADPSGGYGLLGMRERVHLVGGQVRVETAPGEGFSLQVEVPT
jgi:signal transduction histidine kinase